MTDAKNMIPAYFWTASHAPAGILGKLPSYGGEKTAVSVAAREYRRWLSDSDPLKMLAVQSCLLERDWAYEPTGHKAFDEQRRRSSGLTTGNVSSNVQTSMYIRAKTDRDVNGRKFDKGELRAHDLKALDGWRQRGVPNLDLVKRWINDASLDSVTTIVYLLHHYKGTRDSRGYHELLFHGWVLTDEKCNLINSCQTNQGPKSDAIMRQAIKAFTHERLESQDLLRIEAGEVQYVSDEVRALLPADLLELADAAEAGWRERKGQVEADRPRGG